LEELDAATLTVLKEKSLLRWDSIPMMAQILDKLHGLLTQPSSTPMFLRTLCLSSLLALAACSHHEHPPAGNYDRFYKFSPDLLPWIQENGQPEAPPQVISQFRRECESHWTTDDVMTRYCTTSRAKEYLRQDDL
jgi:hypothetical protein